jgi:hypothetical protein
MTTELTLAQRKEACEVIGYAFFGEDDGCWRYTFYMDQSPCFSSLEEAIELVERLNQVMTNSRGRMARVQAIIAERDAQQERIAALEARFAARRTDADSMAWALVDALASPTIDDAMDAVALLAGEQDTDDVDAYDAFDYARELARRAREAREGGAP